MGSSARCARVSGNGDLASLAIGQWAARLAALACRAEYLSSLRSRVGQWGSRSARPRAMGSSARCARVSGSVHVLASLARRAWAARLAALACRAEYLELAALTGRSGYLWVPNDD